MDAINERQERNMQKFPSQLSSSRSQSKPYGYPSSNPHTRDAAPSRLQTMNEAPSVNTSENQPGPPVTLIVWGHDAQISGHEVMLDMSLLPDTKEGDIAELRCKNSQGQRRNLFFIVHPKPYNSNAQISVSSHILTALDLQSRSEVHVRKNTVQAAQIDQLELHFRGAYLSRADLYRISKSLQDKCISVGQRISRLGGLIRLNAEVIYKDGKLKFSGYVGPHTRVVYRSDSAHLTILIQISSEMWEFDETGDVAFQKLMNTFMPVTLKKFNAKGDQHLVSLIFFTSISTSLRKSQLAAGELDSTAESYYKVVVDQLPVSKWAEISKQLRKEFSHFPKDVLLRQKGAFQGTFLPSMKGNILEAINLAVSQIGQKFSDQDFRRTNSQTIIITPSSGVFDVSYRDLYLVSRAVMNVEMGVELVCLARSPLHMTPLFRCKGPDGNLHYHIPTWMNVSFWSTPQRYVNQWLPKATIYDIQMTGILENELRAIPIPRLGQGLLSSKFMKSYDSNLFKSLQTLAEEKALQEKTKALESKPKAPKGLTFKNHPTFESTNIISSANTSKAVLSTVTEVSVASSIEGTENLLSAKSSLGSLLLGQSKAGSTSSISSHKTLSVSAADAIRSLARRLSTNSLRTESGKGTDIPSRDPRSPNSADSTESTGSSTILAPQLTRAEATPKTPGESTQVKDIGIPMSANPRTLSAPIPAPVSQHSRGNPLMTRGPISALRSAQKLRQGSFSSNSPAKESYLDAHFSEKANRYTVASIFNSSHEDFWRVIQNPSILDFPSAGQAYSKWAFVYPPHRKRKNICWNSIESPAAVPICCGEFPSIQQWKEDLKLQFYDLYLGSESDTLSETGKLLDEMISLRLQMGFQIVVGDKVALIEEKFFGSPHLLITDVKKDILGARVYLQRQGTIHRLEVEQEGFIKVQIYTKTDLDRTMVNSVKESKHPIRISSTRLDSYEPLDGMLFNPVLQFDLNWNQLDLQLADIEDAFKESYQNPYLISSRFVLVPVLSTTKSEISPNIAGQLSQEELRVEGIQKLISHLHKYRVDVNSSKTCPPRVHYYTGDLNQCIQNIYETAEMFETLGKALQRDRLSKTISLSDLEREILGKYGPRIEDKRWHWKSYSQVFTGSDFVQWLIDSFQDINNSDEALAYGKSLMEAGLISHADNRHSLLNGHYFYRLNSSSSSSHKHKYPAKEQPSLSTVKNSNASKSAKNVKDGGKTALLVTRKIEVDVDPKKLSNRKETVVIHIDRIHNPLHVFSLKFQWLYTTQRLIDEFVCVLARISSQYGLRLVQVPTSGFNRSGRQYCFQYLMNVKLSVDPMAYLDSLSEDKGAGPDVTGPDDENFKTTIEPLYRVPAPTYSPKDLNTYYHDYFLKSLGYVRDTTETIINLDDFTLQYSWAKPAVRGRHYVHQTGLVLLEIMTDNSFTAVANTVNSSRYGMTGPSDPGGAMSESQVFDQLQEASSNTAFLQKLFIEARSVISPGTNKLTAELV